LFDLGVRLAVFFRLGLSYAKLPDGSRTLFAPSEGKTAQLVDLKVGMKDWSYSENSKRPVGEQEE
jgi:hypothetical protein